MAVNKGLGYEAYKEAYDRLGSTRAVARELDVNPSTVQRCLKEGMERKQEPARDKLSDLGYEVTGKELTSQDAWDSHADSFERSLTIATKEHWSVIERPAGAYVVAHFTDPHVDDNSTPLRLLQHDIEASHELNAIMCHGGDLLNNWPMAGKLAKQWAKQECTLPAAILRAQHYINLMEPDVWVDGNHEEMNGGAYLERLFGEWLDAASPKVIRDYWTARFVVRPEGGREVRFALSHKFQKGRSWFHPHHGVIREAMEGEDADVYMEGHLHISGIIYHTMAERQKNIVGVASAGYKMLDQYAARISRGGVIPKFKGRCHWIVCDDQAGDDEWPGVAFDSVRQAEAYLNGLQNLRAV
jgi:transposase-like protein